MCQISHPYAPDTRSVPRIPGVGFRYVRYTTLNPYRTCDACILVQTRHKSRTPPHLPLPPPLYTTSPRSLLDHLWPSRPTHSYQPPCHEWHRQSSQTCSRYQQIHRCFSLFRSSISEPVDGAAVCVCVCVCARARVRAFVSVCVCVGGW